MIRKYIKKCKDIIYCLKSLWISHIVVFILCLCESFTLFCILLLQNDTSPKDYNFSLSEMLIISHYLLFMLWGIFVVVVICIGILIQILLKKTYITKNYFLTNNPIYHILWSFGMLISISSFITMLIWGTHSLLEEIL